MKSEIRRERKERELVELQAQQRDLAHQEQSLLHQLQSIQHQQQLIRSRIDKITGQSVQYCPYPSAPLPYPHQHGPPMANSAPYPHFNQLNATNRRHSTSYVAPQPPPPCQTDFPPVLDNISPALHHVATMPSYKNSKRRQSDENSLCPEMLEKRSRSCHLPPGWDVMRNKENRPIDDDNQSDQSSTIVNLESYLMPSEKISSQSSRSRRRSIH